MIENISPVGFLVIVFAVTLALSIAVVRLIDVVDSRRLRLRREIPAHKDPRTIGDGACNWTSPPNRYPQRSALIRKMHEEPRGM